MIETRTFLPPIQLANDVRTFDFFQLAQDCYEFALGHHYTRC